VVSSDTTHFNVATVLGFLFIFYLSIVYFMYDPDATITSRFIVPATTMTMVHCCCPDGLWARPGTEAWVKYIWTVVYQHFTVIVLCYAVSCPGGWRQFGLRCYYLSQSLNTWVNSRRECQNMGADLVVIKSQEEMTFLNEFGHKFWIGLSRIDGVWKWIDGSSVIVSDRGNYHPTLYNRYQKTCAAFNILNLQFYTRSSESCESYYRGVCEKEANFNSVI
uniref:C-type lectin domain-containing protein n=1 Tax=Periophthalmus magnuspinnatus TaxID=409849 RepID=A0A3B3ZER9_9GOBI